MIAKPLIRHLCRLLAAGVKRTPRLSYCSLTSEGLVPNGEGKEYQGLPVVSKARHMAEISEAG